MYYITSDDGTKIAVYDYNPQGKQTVFLIHGWPLSHLIFEYQINLLTDYGYRVVAVDLGALAGRIHPYADILMNKCPPIYFRWSGILVLNDLFWRAFPWVAQLP